MFAFRFKLSSFCELSILFILLKNVLGGESIPLNKTVCSTSLQHRTDDKNMFTLNKTKRFQYILCHIYLDTIFHKYKGQLLTRTTSVKQHSSNIVNGLIDSLFKIQYTGYVINIEFLFLKILLNLTHRKYITNYHSFHVKIKSLLKIGEHLWHHF